MPTLIVKNRFCFERILEGKQKRKIITDSENKWKLYDRIYFKNNANEIELCHGTVKSIEEIFYHPKKRFITICQKWIVKEDELDIFAQSIGYSDFKEMIYTEIHPFKKKLIEWDNFKKGTKYTQTNMFNNEEKKG